MVQDTLADHQVETTGGKGHVLGVHDLEGRPLETFGNVPKTVPREKVEDLRAEALSRLRTEEGDIIPAGDFIEYAEAVGLMPKIDNQLVFRCVQVTRRLLLKSRDVGLFCNLSAATLTDALMFRQLLDFMDASLEYS